MKTVKRLGDVCDTSSGGTPSRSVSAYYQEIVGNLDVVCPQRGEQDRIAERLAAMDERIVAEERVIAKYRSVKAGLMQRLLAPPDDAEVAENVSV